jgi:ArsR family transcriptional regulator, arsenate/arsenite/antimonite-responsive transcriptional repressor
MSKRYHKALPRKWTGLASVFTALGDEHRQRILLMFEKGEELTIKDIADSVPLSRTAVTHHIRVLLQVGVLRGEKRGKELYLRPDPARVLGALGALQEYVKEFSS